MPPALVRARGVVLKPHGKDLIGLCPFHDDRDPSLVVTPSKNEWRCLGACGEEGDAVSWVMKAEGVSFRRVVELLRNGWEVSRFRVLDLFVSLSYNQYSEADNRP